MGIDLGPTYEEAMRANEIRRASNEKQAHLAPVAPRGGNTISPRAKRPIEDSEGSTSDIDASRPKRQNGAKRWPFTWNNYPENWVALLAPGLEGAKWIGGFEVGEEGTPHIQGYVEFPTKVRPIGYKGIPLQIHWGDEHGKPCKGDREANVTYCTKQANGYKGNLPVPRALPKVELYGWQTDLAERLEGEPDNREIFWVWSKWGGVGKSSFVRWVMMNKNATLCAGKAADAKYAIVNHKKEHGVYPDIVMYDVPKQNAGFLSYSGMEEIKNGVFCSSKYESGAVIMPYAHLVVLANIPPPSDCKVINIDRFTTFYLDSVNPENGEPDLGHPDNRVDFMTC